MINNEKLTKQILETKYLTVENTNRYRPIIRYFFLQYEKLEYWLYKEEIYNEVKKIVNDYTIELCEQDLERLAEWQTLTKIQDTANVATVDEFKNRKFRYQLSEYAVEIERLVIRLENLHVTSSSLEPIIFEKIKNNLTDLLEEKNIKKVNDLWQELTNNFKNSNENYQDFLKKFYEAKTEELMKTTQFLLFKDEMVKYLREFIKGFQKYHYVISEVIKSFDETKINNIMDMIIDYQKSVPKIEPDFDYDYLRQINYEKWNSISKWFLGSNTFDSESNKLISATNNIINKITKYVNSIIEMYGQSANRNNEYKHICTMFGNMDDMSEVKKLSVAVFGVSSINHVIGISKDTDDINVSSYDTKQAPFLLKSRSYKIKTKITKSTIFDKTLEKENQIKEYLEKIKEEKALLQSYKNKGNIKISELGIITPYERRFLLNLITKGLKSNHKVIQNKEYEMKYQLKKREDERITLEATDGKLEMPNYEIVFLED